MIIIGSRRLLHKAARGSQPSSHSWPIDRGKIRYCCWGAEPRIAVDEHDGAGDEATDVAVAVAVAIAVAAVAVVVVAVVVVVVVAVVDLRPDWLGSGSGSGLGSGLGLGPGRLGQGLEAQLDWRT